MMSQLNIYPSETHSKSSNLLARASKFHPKMDKRNNTTKQEGKVYPVVKKKKNR